MKGATILLADDDTSIRTVLTKYLQSLGYAVMATDSGSTLWKWAKEGLGHVAVSDVVMPDSDGLDLLPKLRKARPTLPIIMMSAKNTVLTALQASERGAFDYLPKPFDLQDLANTVEQALLLNQETAPPAQDGVDLPIVGSSAPMQQVYRLIAKLAPTDLSVLIRGESGTGKELVARVLHDFGKRRAKRFVALNMAAIPAELVESELFGHERGAFTGADAKKDGRFAQAEGGTLFLDEIGDMPLSIQTRLLRILQEGSYTRVGGLREYRADVRIIAATHRNLEEMVADGSFREDLFYRLNVVPIDLPPLRDRLGDLPELVPTLAQGMSVGGAQTKVFTPAAIEALATHHWPGNIRELENFIQRLSAVLPQREVDAREVIDALAPSAAPRAPQGDKTMLVRAESIAQMVAKFYAEGRNGVPHGQVYMHFLERMERPLIEQTLLVTKGNQIQAAALLGLNRNTLRKKVQDLGIRVIRGVGPTPDVGDASA